MDDLTNILARNGYLPHGYCFAWSPDLLWTMVGSDLSIAAAYFSIPMVILSYSRRRPGVNLGGLATLFSLFIFACGITHLLDVWTIWRPDYAVHAGAKLVTAIVSVLTAVAAWRLLPRALAIPSVAELHHALDALQAEVDKRRSAEDSLLETEQSLAAALAMVEAGFLTTDAQGHVTRMNSVAERVTGWPAAEAHGRSVWQVFDRVGRPPEMLARNPLDVLREDGAWARSPQRLVCIARDGHQTPVELHAEVTHHEDGRPRGISLVFRDLARLTEAEAEVRRLAAIVASSSDAIIANTLDGRITDWNASAERMFGYSSAEAIGQPVQMLIPSERETEEMAMLADLAQGRQREPFRTVRLTKDGRRLEVSVQISPIRDAAGRIVGGAKSARDISHQQQVEAALRRSETRLRLALESAALGDWELDLESGDIRRSRRFDLCFGHPTSPSRWSWAQTLQAVHEDERDAVDAAMRHAATQRTPWHGEFRVLWPDGTLHWLRVDASPAEGPTGTPLLLGLVADVTEMRLAEQARRHALQLEAENRRVEESSRMKSQFLANMSHELRTPLNAVIGFADLLRNEAFQPDAAARALYLGHIADGGRHLLQVINDVLDLSKIEAGKLDFQPQPVRVAQAIDEVVATLSVQAADNGLSVDTRLDPAIESVEVDPGRLKQVLYNFLSNAIKFTPSGGRIEVRTRAEGPRHWRLEVQDSGIGIAAEDLPRLFVEFQQLDVGHAKRHQGTGLGLALTRRLVEAQGGSVGVDSRPGAGSCFHAVLPRRASVIDAANDGRALPRVLVVSADRAGRDALARGLTMHGVPVDVAATAADARLRAVNAEYAGLTLDLDLIDRPGLGLVADVRASAGASTYTEVKAVGMQLAAGGHLALAVSDVLAKPFTDDAFARALGVLRPALEAGGPVLVVDDDAAARELMRSALAAAGVEVVTAEGGAEALALLPALRPAAMVLDLMMPDVDGFQVLHAVRHDPNTTDLPVLVWTALSLSSDEVATLSASAQALLSKAADASLSDVLDALVRWARGRDRGADAGPAAS